MNTITFLNPAIQNASPTLQADLPEHHCLHCGHQGIEYLGAEAEAAQPFSRFSAAEIEHEFACPSCGFEWSEIFEDESQEDSGWMAA